MPRFEFEPLDPSDFPDWSLPTLDIGYEAESQSVWMAYRADSAPFYSRQTLTDMLCVMESVRRLHASAQAAEFPIRYFVMASHKPGVFQLGGDLAMFAASIKAGEREPLRAYAHACIDVIHGLVSGLGLPIVTLSVITGQALGGGLEAALAQDFVLAEDGARLGVPEVAFNTFPGMGAVSFLTRRLGAARAEEIIASGEVFTGKQMYEMGVVDIPAPDGGARQAAIDWMMRGGQDRFRRRLSLSQARRRFFPVSYEELIRITDVWVDCSCDVTPADVRHMERLAKAQKRMLGQAAAEVYAT